MAERTKHTDESRHEIADLNKRDPGIENLGAVIDLGNIPYDTRGAFEKRPESLSTRKNPGRERAGLRQRRLAMLGNRLNNVELK